MVPPTPYIKSIVPDVVAGTDNFIFEKHLRSHGYERISGCDEVGRGPLAGPVVAAAVVLPENCDPTPFLDSKRLSHTSRIELHRQLIEMETDIGIGIVSESDIDKINILQASLLAMKIANEKLRDGLPDFILVDGKFTIPAEIPQQALVKGESKSGSIAAASIVAKVTRDRLMTEIHTKYPQYNFKKNKGYPTKEHRAAIEEHGPCPIHRMSFKGVREYAQ